MLTQRFSLAFPYAADAHGGQTRKGSGIPYIGHLMDVSAIVLLYGGTEDQAIGALLHDAAEDAGGRARLEDIRQNFGDAVAEIVEGCTDTFDDPKPAWLPRKKAYIAHIATLPATTLLVSAADKLSNARAILTDYRQHGERVWDRFTGKREGTLWYYRAVASALAAAFSSPCVDDLLRTVDELERVAGERVT